MLANMKPVHRITLSPGLLHVVLQSCRDALPNEACGFLLGHNDDVLFVVPMVNTHPEPAHHYRIEPHAAAQAVHSAVRLGVDVLGGWHSHPNGPDVLSPADARGSPGDEYVHLLVGRGESLQAFRVFAPTRIRSIPIALRHGTHGHASERADVAAGAADALR